MKQCRGAEQCPLPCVTHPCCQIICHRAAATPQKPVRFCHSLPTSLFPPCCCPLLTNPGTYCHEHIRDSFGVIHHHRFHRPVQHAYLQGPLLLLVLHGILQAQRSTATSSGTSAGHPYPTIKPKALPCLVHNCGGHRVCCRAQCKAARKAPTPPLCCKQDIQPQSKGCSWKDVGGILTPLRSM